jgi:LysM repeat protein
MRIASNFGVTPEAIVAYNGWEGLEHALNPGDAIRIPPSDYDPNATTAPSPSAAPAGSDGPACADGTQQERYTISAGDTRGRVAARFDVTVDELDAANAGTEFYDAFVLGVEIVIPC